MATSRVSILNQLTQTNDLIWRFLPDRRERDQPFRGTQVGWASGTDPELLAACGETERGDPVGNKCLSSQLLALWAGLCSASIEEVFLEAVWYLLTFLCRVELTSQKHVCAHACGRQERSRQR